ncbi:LOW QUALITY PROTEIN: hypothetical protein V1477_015040 [Vespula maculifrons]|uniref:Transposase n=1 Tax=Vespula maculifrons TaxID=7453 RepID=A0ABD2BJ57_VESMC
MKERIYCRIYGRCTNERKLNVLRNFVGIENLGKILKNAAIRSVILAVYESSMYHKYFRPRSHRVEVAALRDPRANGESTLKSAIRDAFPLRELRASQQTGDV